MDGANQAAFCEMPHVIKYVLGMRKLVLKIEQSVSGFIFCMLSLPVAKVTSKEVMFMIQILPSMKISINLPVMVCVDNVDATFMADNVTAMSQTKHVDVWYNYLNLYIEDDKVKIVHYVSAKNDSNNLMKNLGG